MLSRSSRCTQSNTNTANTGCQCDSFCPGYGNPPEGSRCPPLITLVSLWLETEKYQQGQLEAFRRMVTASKLPQ
jgi:hypothetical protein